MKKDFENIMLDTFKKTDRSSDILIDRTPIIEQLTQLGKVATLVSFDNVTVSPDCENGMESSPKELLEELQNHSLENYYNNKLANRTKFFKKMSNDEIMTYTPVRLILSYCNVIFQFIGIDFNSADDYGR